MDGSQLKLLKIINEKKKKMTPVKELE